MDNPLAYACNFDKRSAERVTHSGRASYTTPWDTSRSRIELVTRTGYRVMVEGAVDAHALARVLDVLERR